MRSFVLIGALALLAVTISKGDMQIHSPNIAGGSAVSFKGAAYIRVNQLGYLTNDKKIGLLLTNANMKSVLFRVKSRFDGAVAFTGTIGSDRGAYGKFKHVYSADFGEVKTNGDYYLEIPGNTIKDTISFKISDAAYDDLIPGYLLKFFKVNRCGMVDSAVSRHRNCHLFNGATGEGIIASFDGKPIVPEKTIDASGGWHDAGDYIKFMITTGYVTNLLLSSYEAHPKALRNLSDANGLPDILDEAKIGLDWMVRMWHPEDHMLYFQVADGRDHETWDMFPDKDTNRCRYVLTCENGKGANIAGKAAASLSLASGLWKTRDKALSEKYLKIAKEIYDWGLQRKGAQSGKANVKNDDDYYSEATWQHDMALAAVELFKATSDSVYLRAAKGFLNETEIALGWDNLSALAFYKIAKIDSTFVPIFKKKFKEALDSVVDKMDKNRFYFGVSYGWGSLETSANAATMALLYEDITNDSRYRDMAIHQRDYALGRNPWGVCFVNGVGKVWPHNPEHIIDLAYKAAGKPIELTGFWDEGPISQKEFKELGIELQAPDAYKMFQTKEAVYHDDGQDFATNEPTITMNASGIYLCSWFMK